MRRIISILFIAVSVIFLLAFVILPHHHHGGAICIIMEVCEQDNKVNDEHTHHSDMPNDEHNESCIVETEYVAPFSKNEIKCKILSCKNHHHNHLYLFPVYFLVADLLNFGTGNAFFQTAYGEHISLYESAEAVWVNGLRAPPFILS